MMRQTWQNFMKNPTIRLGRGKTPRGTSRFKRQDELGTSWKKGFGPLNSGVLGAIVYSNSVIAQKMLKDKKTKQKFAEGIKVPVDSFDLVLKIKTIIAMEKGKSADKISVFPRNGSPYFKPPQLVQSKSSDEPEDRLYYDKLTGATDREEGAARRAGVSKHREVLITIPHAFNDGVEDGHDTDFKAADSANEIGMHLGRKGIDATVLKGDIDRDKVDLNREISQFTPFHIALDEVLESSPDILLDIHSYPEDYPVWRGYDVILFANGPLHDDEDNENTLALAEHIQRKCPTIRLLVDIGDFERHYIQNKGLFNNVEAHLIEFNESTNTKQAERAIAEYASGMKENVPTVIPPGVKWQQISVRVRLGTEEEERRATSLEMLELELEERGFTKVKQTYSGNIPIVSRMTFRIPESIIEGAEGPLLMVQRNQRSVVLMKVNYLNNDDLILLQTLIEESSRSQPKLNPDKGVEEAIIEMLDNKGVDEKMHIGIIALVAKGAFEPLKALRDKKNLPLSNTEINTLLKLNKGGKTLDKNSKDDEIIKVLKEQGKDIPRTKDGKFNRQEALKLANRDVTVAVKGVADFKVSKKKKMNLSTPVSRMVISALIPGAGLKKKQQKKEQQKKDQQKKEQQKKEQQKKEQQKKEQQNKEQQKKDQQKKDQQKKEAAKTNPPVYARPKEGKFLMDVTDHQSWDPVIYIDGSGNPQLDVSRSSPWGHVIPSHPLGDGKGKGNIVRVNMFRRKAGFKIEGASIQPNYIISIETGGKHFYARDSVKVGRIARLRHFPNKKSEPRLRLETKGHLVTGESVGTVVIRGKKHPLYGSVIVRHGEKILSNPGSVASYAADYIDDHQVMNPSEETQKFKRLKLKGSVGSTEFFEQISQKMQDFGEGQGWVRDGFLYWKKGPGHQNFVHVDGHMLKGGTAWMHTHPGAWEPSQTSPDDFKVMHGLFTHHGIQDCFTIIADRVDWFHFAKKDRVPLKDMVDVIQDFEESIMTEFAIAESDFQDQKGDTPFLTLEQTRYITEHLNRTLPQFQVKYKAYSFSPQQINERVKRNPPNTLDIHGLY